MLATLGAALAPPHGAALDPAAALAARLVSDLHDHAHSDHYERLVLDLFRLNILVPVRPFAFYIFHSYCAVKLLRSNSYRSKQVLPMFINLGTDSP